MGWFPGSSSWPRGVMAVTRRDTRMDTGLVHRHGHLSGHTNHTPGALQNFQPDCRDISETGGTRVSQRSQKPHQSHPLHTRIRWLTNEPIPSVVEEQALRAIPRWSGRDPRDPSLGG